MEIQTLFVVSPLLAEFRKTSKALTAFHAQYTEKVNEYYDRTRYNVQYNLSDVMAYTPGRVQDGDIKLIRRVADKVTVCTRTHDGEVFPYQLDYCYNGRIAFSVMFQENQSKQVQQSVEGDFSRTNEHTAKPCHRATEMLMGFANWERLVDNAVKDILGVPDSDAVGLTGYGMKAVATHFGLEPHPMGEPDNAYHQQVAPDEYAKHIGNELIKAGWVY